MMAAKQIKLIIIYFSVIFLFFFTAYLFLSHVPEFKNYHCEKAGFSILIPGKTKEINDKFRTFISQFDITQVSSGNNYWKFMAICFEPNQTYHPPVWFSKEEQTPLESMKMAAEMITGGRLINEKDANYCGYPAKDFELNIRDRKTAKARAIIINKKFYELIVISDSKKALQKVPEFFESFKIDKQK